MAAPGACAAVRMGEGSGVERNGDLDRGALLTLLLLQATTST